MSYRGCCAWSCDEKLLFRPVASRVVDMTSGLHIILGQVSHGDEFCERHKTRGTRRSQHSLSWYVTNLVHVSEEHLRKSPLRRRRSFLRRSFLRRSFFRRV